MADVHNAETRSRNMRAIGSKDTSPEVSVRSYLHRAGLRFSLHRKNLPGTPDLVLPKRSAVVFVHGCYWHRHRGCRFTTTPKTNVEFWQNKFGENQERDKRDRAALKKLGWKVFVIWECQAKSSQHLDKLVASLKKAV
jgi:DNA mismatch endonuclease (patch repair protein)